jgi:DNA-binding NtrC family response regulator
VSHPFVQAYLESDLSLLRLLKEAPPDSALEAMRALRQSIAGSVPAERALAQAAAVSGSIPDADLFLLFCILWAMACCTARRIEEMEAVLRRAESTVGAATPRELVAALLQQRGMLAAARGNIQERERLERQASERVPRQSPRYSEFVRDRAAFLAYLGRLSDVESELKRLSPRPGSRFEGFIRFVDAVETGRVAEADSLRAQTEPFRTHPNFGEETRLYVSALDLMAGRRPGEDAPPSTEVLSLLLSRRPEEALRRVRRQAAADSTPFWLETGIDSYNLVRAELSCRHGSAARSLIQKRRRLGNAHPWDELFLARADLLSGDRCSARSRIGETLRWAERYRAEGRFDFELRMACELSAADLLRLERAEPRPAGPSESKRKVGNLRLIGSSRALEKVRRAVRKFAALDAPVLITGETGTGKELAARALHEEGPRRRLPWIAVNCAALSESLLESELFGHERGAFTGAARDHAGLFEQAGAGTIFLDEVGDMSPRLQASLLRVLEHREIRRVGGTSDRPLSCRVVAATHADLNKLAAQGRFREDLAFRLRALEIRMPALRERPEDVEELALHFLNEGRAGGSGATLTVALRETLRNRAWPGNVRELRNAVERMRLLNSDRLSYDASHLEPVEEPAASMDDVERLLASGRTAVRRRDRLRDLFRRFRKLTAGEAARVLRVSAPTAARDLRALRDEGAIERVEPSHSTRSHYFIWKG